MRRGLGPGRAIVGVGALLAIIGVFLPWSYAGGGDSELPRVTSDGFQGPAVATFVAAVLLLALLVLPYATSSGRSGLDRWLSFVILGGVMAVGAVLHVLQLVPGGALKLTTAARRARAVPRRRGQPCWSSGACRDRQRRGRARAASGPRHMTPFRPPRRR